MGEPRKPSEWIDDRFGRNLSKLNDDVFAADCLFDAIRAYLDELQRLNPGLKWPE